MDTTLLLSIAAAVVSMIAVAILVAALRQFLDQDSNVRSRLDTYLYTQASTEDEADAAAAASFSERLNETINRQSFASRVVQELQQANLPITVSEYVLLRIAVPLLLMLVALLVWRNLLIVVAALILGYVLPIFWLRSRRSQRNRDFAEQLPETLQLLGSALRGGFSVPQAMKHVARESPEPTRGELQRVGQELQLGLSLPDALDHLVQRMESDDLDMVVTAIKINARVGGNLAQILDSISNTVRERGKLRREVLVITSMQRLSSYVIGLLPVVLALIIFAINPDYMSRLFEPGWTLCIPIGAAVFAIAGFVIIQRMADIKV